MNFIFIIVECSNNCFLLKQMLRQIYYSSLLFLSKGNLSSRWRVFILIRYSWRSRYLGLWTSLSSPGYNFPYPPSSVYAAMAVDVCYTVVAFGYLIHALCIFLVWRPDIFSYTSFLSALVWPPSLQVRKSLLSPDMLPSGPLAYAPDFLKCLVLETKHSVQS